MLNVEPLLVQVGFGVVSILLAIVVLMVRPRLITFVTTVISEEYRSPRLTAFVTYVVLVACICQLVVGFFALMGALTELGI